MAANNAAFKEKVAIVDEVQTRLRASVASIVSEYRGLSVAELKDLRIALANAGGDYRVFKNTLVRRAITDSEYQPLAEYLEGPTALTFVEGDVSAVAKALRDFSRANPLLVIKGGLADGSLLSSSELNALAELPPRDVLLARIAGALAAPLQQMAGLLQALPRNLAYGLSALIDQREAGGETLPPPVAEAAAEAPAGAEAAEAPAAEAPAEAEAPAAEAPATEAPVAEAEAPEAEAAAEPEVEAAAEPAAEAEAPAEAEAAE
ncbi:MAG TPA: 50S ribosomal protein L10 [Acidimicrobiales bacterium]|jgi:large subunit ribosomal protein L10